MSNSPIVIRNAFRTPIGSFQGGLSDLTAPMLGGTCIKKVIDAGASPSSLVDEIIMGCVLPAGIGQAPARQAAINGGVPVTSGAATINKMCGSGLYAVMLAHDMISCGTRQRMIAGGMESMTNAPYLLPKARGGLRMGHDKVIDHMFLDGLEDAYDQGALMGVFAEKCARKFSFSRSDQDEFAITSLERALKAIEKGLFVNEIVSISHTTRKGSVTIDQDEQPLKANPDKIPELKPAFEPQGTITAANASSISDGAAALYLSRLEDADKDGDGPLAIIKAHATHAQEPQWFTTAPVGAIQKVLEMSGWNVADVDLFEINEAFACVPMVAMRELSLPHDVVNIHGGACALGHPIGASGARILVTLVHALQKYDLDKGIAALCLGGGEAVAVALERCK